MRALIDLYYDLKLLVYTGLWWWRDYTQQLADEREVDWTRRESMARIRWARAMHEAEKCYRDNNYY
jgi:hypothetical protein